MGLERERWVCSLDDTGKKNKIKIEEACSLAEAVELERPAGENRRENSSEELLPLG